MCLLLGSSAWGLTTTQTKSFDLVPNFTETLTFDKFDDHGGLWTLNGVYVSMGWQLNGGKLVLDNDGQLPASGEFEIGSDITIESSLPLYSALNQNPIRLWASNGTSITSFNLAANQGDALGDYDPTGPDGFKFEMGSLSDGITNIQVASSGYPGLMGLGTFDFIASANQSFTTSSLSGVEVQYTPVKYSGYTTLVYDYSVVPEPSTVAGLLSGIGALAFGIKRKIRR
jgi:hypothetical protein